MQASICQLYLLSPTLHTRFQPTNQTMHDRRQHPRIKPNQLLELFDTNTLKPFGNVVDLSCGGIMAITKQNIEINSVFQMAIKLPEGYSETPHIEFGAEVLWVEKCGDTEQSWFGLEIIDISTSASEELEHLIDNVHEPAT